MNLFHVLMAAALALGAPLAGAQGAKHGAIEIVHPWARATAPGQAAGGGFLEIRNGGAADRLVAASSAAAARVELHRMTMEGDVMRMRQVDAIDLPAGGRVALEPGGLHLMFMGLKRPLAAGSRIPLKLKFEKAGELTVEVKVDAATALPRQGGHAH